MRKTLYILFLAAAILIAGCTSGEKTVTQNKDVLKISSISVTPNTVVAPGDIITIRMKLENIGQEDVNFTWRNPCYAANSLSNAPDLSVPSPIAPPGPSKREASCLNSGCAYRTADSFCYSWDPLCYDEYCPVKDVKAANAADPMFVPLKEKTDLSSILYDYCGSLYTPQNFLLVADGFDGKGTQLTLKPSRSAILEWTIRAPSEEKIARMQQECDFKFQVNYKASAQTNTYIYFAHPDEKNQRTYTKKDLSLAGENIANFGPVYINFETAQEQPIKGGTTNKWTFYVNARNIGDGIGNIVKDSFKVQLPGTAALPASADCPDFNPANPLTYNTAKDTDQSRLRLYSKQSSRFSCTLPAPEVPYLDLFHFISTADYVYTLDREIKILTVPKRA